MRLAALDIGVIWSVLHNPIAQCQDIDALFCLNTNDGKVDSVDELRGSTIIDLDDGKSAFDGSGIDADRPHDTPRMRYPPPSLRTQTPNGRRELFSCAT